MTQDKAEKGDYLASALIGINRAGAGSLNAALNPIDTAKGIIEALRSPRKSGRAAITALKQDFKDDPIATVTELLTPMPGPKGLKPRKIVVPESLALDHEINALREASAELGQDRLVRRPKTNRDERLGLDIIDENDQLRWQEQYAQTFGGWYPGEDGILRKDIGPVGYNTAAFDARAKSKFELADIIKHPNLIQRLLRANRPLPILKRDAHDPLVGGGYWDGSYLSGGRTDRPEVRVGGDAPSSFNKTLNHEVQHVTQDFGDLRNPYRGANYSGNDARSYFGNPGEIEARIAGLRANMTQAQRDRVSFPAQYAREKRFQRENKGEPRGMNRMEHMEHVYSPEEREVIAKRARDAAQLFNFQIPSEMK